MAFPWLAVAGAVTGIASSLIQSNEQSNAAEQANALAKEKAEAQYQRALKEWEIDYQARMADWSWQVAQTEAARYVERQKQADYNWRAGQLIDAAMTNLEVNVEALTDRYVTEEGLRAQQVGMQYGYQMNELAATSGEAVRQYMAGIRDSALQGMQIASQAERQSQELMSSLVFEGQRDQLQWEIGQISSVIDGAQAAAVAGGRMGNSSSAKRLALNAAQKLGRTWGEMDLRAKNRDARVALLNGAMQGETALQMGRLALSMQDQAQKLKYTTNKYASDAAYESAIFRDLTIPSFGLAGRQGAREMKSLEIETNSVLAEASMPYRQAIIFDPIQPIKGLKPEYMAPTPVYGGSALGAIGNAIIGGAQNAISFGTYTKSDGSLGWR